MKTKRKREDGFIYFLEYLLSLLVFIVLLPFAVIILVGHLIYTANIVNHEDFEEDEKSIKSLVDINKEENRTREKGDGTEC